MNKSLLLFWAFDKLFYQNRYHKPERSVKSSLVLMLSIAAMLVFVQNVYASVKIRFKAVNPSTIESRTVKVRYDLPPEITKEDILSADGLKIKWDTETTAYYVYDDIEFEPGESRVFQITVNDVWRIPKDEIERVKTYLEKKVLAFKDEENFQKVMAWEENITRRINEVEESQDKEYQDVRKRIDTFRADWESLKSTKAEVFRIDTIEDIVNDTSDGRKVDLSVNLANPSTTEPTTQPEVIYYLPEEVRKEDILVKTIFDIQYDPNKNQYFLKAENLKLDPAEQKNLVVQLRDIWYLSEEMLKSYVREAKGIADILQVSKYAEIANVLYEEIRRLVDDVLKLQALAESLRDRMANYSGNQEKLDRIRNKLKELRDYRMLVKDLIKQIDEQAKTEEINTALLAAAEAPKKRDKTVSAGRMVAVSVSFLFVIAMTFYFFWLVQTAKGEERRYHKIDQQQK